jgi:di/tricarboxylate transporter
MFEFTALGLLVSAVGTAYLLTVGRWLTPARIPLREDLTDEFELEECPTEVVVEDDSPLVGRTVADALAVVVGGVLKPPEVYDAVEWDVIFLLAGVIPLGIAMEKTGGADLLADLVVASADVLLAIAVLGLFYVVTALLTNVISNNASVVLMIPVAAEAAAQLDGNASRSCWWSRSRPRPPS